MPYYVIVSTTIFDHHASPGAIGDSLFHIAQATQKMGVRSCLSYEVSDRDGEKVTQQGIEENRQFISYCNQSKDSMLKGMFGLHASFTLSDQTLTKCREVAEGLDAGFHVHAAEALADVEHCQTHYGKRVVERLNEFGILGRKTIAAHCVHVNEQEITLLKDSLTNVVHNPPTSLCADNINSHILFGMSGRSVDTTIINGRIVMEEGKMVGIDEEQIMAKSRELGTKVWQRF